MRRPPKQTLDNSFESAAGLSQSRSVIEGSACAGIRDSDVLSGIIWVYIQTVRTVIETPTFKKQADAIWTTHEREAFIDFIAENPDAGDVIPGADGARKVRWQRQGAGKRGGARFIYFHLVGDEVVLLVMVYAKAERANVKPKDIKRS